MDYTLKSQLSPFSIPTAILPQNVPSGLTNADPAFCHGLEGDKIRALIRVKGAQSSKPRHCIEDSKGSGNTTAIPQNRSAGDCAA